MPPLFSKAVVLKISDYGESDKIITFFTEHFGKLTAIAKGAKRSKKRFVNKLEYFSLLEISVVAGRHSSLFRLDEASLLKPFPQLRENYQRYTAAMLVCELIDHWTRENDCDEALFTLLSWTLDSLNDSPSISATVIFFQLKMFDILGIGLQIDHCLACGKFDAASSPFSFSPAHNGIICSKCRTDEPTPLSVLSMPTLKTLQMAKFLPLEKLSRLKISQNSLEQAAAALKNFSHFQLQRDIQSWKQFKLTL